MGDALETWHTAVEIQLVRHGETQTYARDTGLTELGQEQSRTYARDLAAELADGDVIRLVCAPAARAARTADEVCRSLREDAQVQVLGPEVMREFQNFQIRTPSGLRDVTQISPEEREEAARLGQDGPGNGPHWLFELHQFHSKRARDGDAIEHWLKSPLLSFEPPALVVRRFWLGARRVVGERPGGSGGSPPTSNKGSGGSPPTSNKGSGGSPPTSNKGSGGSPRIVCCTHSGPMRAFAAWALGRDLGEPDHVERVTIRVDRDFRQARVTYREASHVVPVPPDGEPPAWWDTRQPD